MPAAKKAAKKVVKKAVKKPEEKKPSKMSKARELFKQFGVNAQRKDILEAFMKECDLSKAAASTYYEIIRKA